MSTTVTGTTPGQNGVLSFAAAMATKWDSFQEQYDAYWAWCQDPRAWPLFVWKGAPYQNGVSLIPLSQERNDLVRQLLADGVTIAEEPYVGTIQSPYNWMKMLAGYSIIQVPPGEGPDGTILLPPVVAGQPFITGYITVSLVLPKPPFVVPPIPPPPPQPKNPVGILILPHGNPNGVGDWYQPAKGDVTPVGTWFYAGKIQGKTAPGVGVANTYLKTDEGQGMIGQDTIVWVKKS